MARVLGIACGAVAWVALLALGACSLEASDDAGRRCPGSSDAGCARNENEEAGPASVVDASSGAVPDARLRDVDAGGSVPPEDGREGSDDPSECFNGRDDDGYGGIDCADDVCRPHPVCCVGVVSDECCTGIAALGGWDGAGTCTGPIAECAPEAVDRIFGDPLPGVVDGAFVPHGSERGDAGMVLAQRVSPSTAIVRLAARIAAPLGCDGCVDAIAVGLARNAFGDSRITPVLAVQVSGSRGEAMLVSGTTMLWRRPLPDAAEHDYALTVRPDGQVVLETDFATADFRMPEVQPGELDVVVYGRSTNPDAASGVRLRSLAVTSSSCDIPGALRRGEATLAQHSATPFPDGRARAPSIAQADPADPTTARMAFEANGSIWIARPDGAGGFDVALGANPALVAGSAGLQRGAEDPELVPIAEREAWLLLVTVRDADGRRRVQRVVGDAGWVETFDPSRLEDVVTLPIVDERRGNLVELDGASVVARDADVLTLVARGIRERDGTRTSEIVLLRTRFEADTGATASTLVTDICGTSCASVDDTTAISSAIHAPRRDESEAFDRDEVAAPAIVRHGDVYRLYYAGRRATRWSIGMLVSYDLRFFRSPTGGEPVLTGSGVGADALGVMDPEPWLGHGALRLYYTGTDGALTHVLAADQTIR